MVNDIAPLPSTPEESELNRLQAELQGLESLLAQRELDLATLRAALQSFEQQYLAIVGVRYAALDKLQAAIAAAFARQNPHDAHAQAAAQQADARAAESAWATHDSRDRQPAPAFAPSDALKQLYRQAAKQVHPDLTTDVQERQRRTRVMAEVNQAYAQGDAKRLQTILQEWDMSPDAIQGEGVGPALIRTIRRIAQVSARLSAIDQEILVQERSPYHELMLRVAKAASEHRDLLAEMAAMLDHQIDEVRQSLRDLSR